MRVLLEDIQGEFRISRDKIAESKLPNGVTVSIIPGRLSICDTINGNNRRYRKAVWEKNLQEGSALMEMVKRNAAFGLLEHPKDGQVDLNSPISHIVTSVKLVENEVHGEIKVLKTAEGDKLMALIEGGYNPLVSSRGFGSLTKGTDGVDEVQDDYVCEGWDVVLKPSFKEASLSPQREALEDGSGTAGSSKSEPKKGVAADTMAAGIMGSTKSGSEKSSAAPAGGSASEVIGASAAAAPAAAPAEYDAVANIMAYENGELGEEETVAFFQHLVDTGLAWQLQGSYGRAAQALINAGLVHAKGGSSQPRIPESISETKPAPAGQESSSASNKKVVGNAAVPANTKKENTIMDKAQIRASLESLKVVDPSKVEPSRFAEGLSTLAGLHNEVAAYIAEDPKRSWEGKQLHDEIAGIEARWNESANAPKAAAKKLGEDNTKLMKIIKAVGTTGLEYKKQLSEALKASSGLKELTEELTRRGRGWKALAEKAKTDNNAFAAKYKIATEALDIMAGRYKDDMTATGRRVLELEFKDKLTNPEIAKALKEAKLPKDLIAIREQLEGKKGKKPAAAAPAPAAATGTAPVQDNKSGEVKPPVVTESVTIVNRVLSDPRMVNESIDMVRRLSGASATAAAK